MKRIKVNILSPGRFHVCDLARELDKNGFDVKFYSFVPSRRTENFGLPRNCSVSILPLIAVFLLLERKLFKQQGWAYRLRVRMQDWIVSLIMRKCDVCIAMSGEFLLSPQKAKKDNAIIIYERGSKHIAEQRKVLESIPSLVGTKPVPDFNYYREIESYKLADFIAIASKHVKESFEPYDFPLDHLFMNPYGVDLTMFKPAFHTGKVYDVIMVGGWSYRKGCDLIIEAIKRTGLNFLHVGGIVDLAFPVGIPNMTHVNAVDQCELINFYNQSKVFLLPSREEGLAMVQAQAIACNLPVVGSYDSGAEDLRSMVAQPRYITIIKDYSVEAVVDGIKAALENYKSLSMNLYAGDAISNLTWEAYGKRYADFLRHIINK